MRDSRRHSTIECVVQSPLKRGLLLTIAANFPDFGVHLRWWQCNARSTRLTPPFHSYRLSIAAVTQRLITWPLGQQAARMGTFVFLLTPVSRTGHALVAHRAAVDGMCKQVWTGLRGVLFAGTSIVLFHEMTGRSRFCPSFDNIYGT
jgi:hypothetical protein